MKIRKHFRTNTSTIDYIIADLNLNKINKQDYLENCIAEKVDKVNKRYDRELDRITTFIILRCNCEDLPLEALSQITMSLTKVMNILNRGFLTIIGDK